MTEQKFAEIKNKIKELENRSIEAKSRMSLIKEQWKDKYGFEDLDSAKNKLSELEQEIKQKEEKKNELMTKLETSFDWDSV